MDSFRPTASTSAATSRAALPSASSFGAWFARQTPLAVHTAAEPSPAELRASLRADSVPDSGEQRTLSRSDRQRPVGTTSVSRYWIAGDDETMYATAAEAHAARMAQGGPYRRVERVITERCVHGGEERTWVDRRTEEERLMDGERARMRQEAVERERVERWEREEREVRTSRDLARRAAREVAERAARMAEAREREEVWSDYALALQGWEWAGRSGDAIAIAQYAAEVWARWLRVVVVLGDDLGDWIERMQWLEWLESQRLQREYEQSEQEERADLVAGRQREDSGLARKDMPRDFGHILHFPGGSARQAQYQATAEDAPEKDE